MANQIQDNILEAIDVLTNHRINSSKTDKTIAATIVKLTDAFSGQYKLLYNGGYLYAYDKTNANYEANDDVYVLVPEGDFTKKKIILGDSSSAGESGNISFVTSRLNDFNLVGKNVIKSNSKDPIGLCSYIPQQEKAVYRYAQADANEVYSFNIDTQELANSCRNADGILIQADFLTKMPKEHRLSRTGNYGLSIGLAFADGNDSVYTYDTYLPLVRPMWNFNNGAESDTKTYPYKWEITDSEGNVTSSGLNTISETNPMFIVQQKDEITNNDDNFKNAREIIVDIWKQKNTSYIYEARKSNGSIDDSKSIKWAVDSVKKVLINNLIDQYKSYLDKNKDSLSTTERQAVESFIDEWTHGNFELDYAGIIQSNNNLSTSTSSGSSYKPDSKDETDAQILGYISSINAIWANENEFSQKCSLVEKYFDAINLFIVNYNITDTDTKPRRAFLNKLVEQNRSFISGSVLGQNEAMGEEKTYKAKIEYYTFDKLNITGDPYNLPVYNTCQIIEDCDWEHFLYIDSITAFCYGFTSVDESTTYPNYNPDIWIDKLMLYPLKKISAESNGFKLSIGTPQGSTFKESDAANAELSVVAHMVANETQNVTDTTSFYWFKEDPSVSSIESEDYSEYAGVGWRKLTNESKGYTLNVKKVNNRAYENKYLCVATYKEKVTLKTQFSIYNAAAYVKITLESSLGNKFSFDGGKTELTCKINDRISDFEVDIKGQPNYHTDYQYIFTWSIKNEDGSYKAILSQAEYDANIKSLADQISKLTEDLGKITGSDTDAATKRNKIMEQMRNLSTQKVQMTNDKDRFSGIEISYATQDGTAVNNGVLANKLIFPTKIIASAGSAVIRCSVMRTEATIVNPSDNAKEKCYILGSADITLENENVATTANYRIVIENGDQVFQYSEAGVSPANERYKDPLTIRPLSVHFYQPSGAEVDTSKYTLRWLVPLDSTMIVTPSAGMVENPKNNNKKEISVTQVFQLEIKDNYDYSALNNQITAIINYNGEEYTQPTQFLFTKVGENGTNGTDVVARITSRSDSTVLNEDMLSLWVLPEIVEKDDKGNSTTYNEGNKKAIWNTGQSIEDAILNFNLYQRNEKLALTNEFPVWSIAGGKQTNNSKYFTVKALDSSAVVSYTEKVIEEPMIDSLENIVPLTFAEKDEIRTPGLVLTGSNKVDLIENFQNYYKQQDLNYLNVPCQDDDPIPPFKKEGDSIVTEEKEITLKDKDDKILSTVKAQVPIPVYLTETTEYTVVKRNEDGSSIQIDDNDNNSKTFVYHYTFDENGNVETDKNGVAQKVKYETIVYDKVSRKKNYISKSGRITNIYEPKDKDHLTDYVQRVYTKADYDNRLVPVGYKQNGTKTVKKEDGTTEEVVNWTIDCSIDFCGNKYTDQKLVGKPVVKAQAKYVLDEDKSNTSVIDYFEVSISNPYEFLSTPAPEGEDPQAYRSNHYAENNNFVIEYEYQKLYGSLEPKMHKTDNYLQRKFRNQIVRADITHKIVDASMEVSKDQKYYAFYTIPVIVNHIDNTNYRLHVKNNSTIKSVLYNADGHNPLYNKNQGAEISISKVNVDVDHSSLKYDDVKNSIAIEVSDNEISEEEYSNWAVKWMAEGGEPSTSTAWVINSRTNKPEKKTIYGAATTPDFKLISYRNSKDGKLSIESSSHPKTTVDGDPVYDEQGRLQTSSDFIKMIYILPNDIYSGAYCNNVIHGQISHLEKQSDGSTKFVVYFDVYIPIYMSLNTFGLASLNAWDGNKVEINEQDNYIMAPQIGAGVKDDQNKFTGIVMGKAQTYDQASKSEYDVGLLGYSAGLQSIHLDAKTGNAIFGLPDSVSDPDQEGIHTEGRIKLIPGGMSSIGTWNIGDKSLFNIRNLGNPETSEYYENSETTGQRQLRDDMILPYLDLEQENTDHKSDTEWTDYSVSIPSIKSGVLLNSDPSYLSIKSKQLNDNDDIKFNNANTIIQRNDSFEIEMNPQRSSLFTVYRHTDSPSVSLVQLSPGQFEALLEKGENENKDIKDIFDNFTPFKGQDNNAKQVKQIFKQTFGSRTIIIDADYWDSTTKTLKADENGHYTNVPVYAYGYYDVDDLILDVNKTYEKVTDVPVSNVSYDPKSYDESGNLSDSNPSKQLGWVGCQEYINEWDYGSQKKLDDRQHPGYVIASSWRSNDDSRQQIIVDENGKPTNKTNKYWRITNFHLVDFNNIPEPDLDGIITSSMYQEMKNRKVFRWNATMALGGKDTAAIPDGVTGAYNTYSMQLLNKITRWRRYATVGIDSQGRFYTNALREGVTTLNIGEIGAFGNNATQKQYYGASVGIGPDQNSLFKMFTDVKDVNNVNGTLYYSGGTDITNEYPRPLGFYGRNIGLFANDNGSVSKVSNLKIELGDKYFDYYQNTSTDTDEVTGEDYNDGDLYGGRMSGSIKDNRPYSLDIKGDDKRVYLGYEEDVNSNISTKAGSTWKRNYTDDKGTTHTVSYEVLDHGKKTYMELSQTHQSSLKSTTGMLISARMPYEEDKDGTVENSLEIYGDDRLRIVSGKNNKNQEWVFQPYLNRLKDKNVFVDENENWLGSYILPHKTKYDIDFRSVTNEQEKTQEDENNTTSDNETVWESNYDSLLSTHDLSFMVGKILKGGFGPLTMTPDENSGEPIKTISPAFTMSADGDGLEIVSNDFVPIYRGLEDKKPQGVVSQASGQGFKIFIPSTNGSSQNFSNNFPGKSPQDKNQFTGSLDPRYIPHTSPKQMQIYSHAGITLEGGGRNYSYGAINIISHGNEKGSTSVDPNETGGGIYLCAYPDNPSGGSFVNFDGAILSLIPTAYQADSPYEGRTVISRASSFSLITAGASITSFYGSDTSPLPVNRVTNQASGVELKENVVAHNILIPNDYNPINAPHPSGGQYSLCLDPGANANIGGYLDVMGNITVYAPDSSDVQVRLYQSDGKIEGHGDIEFKYNKEQRSLSEIIQGLEKRITDLEGRSYVDLDTYNNHVHTIGTRDIFIPNVPSSDSGLTVNNLGFRSLRQSHTSSEGITADYYVPAIIANSSNLSWGITLSHDISSNRTGTPDEQQGKNER